MNSWRRSETPYKPSLAEIQLSREGEDHDVSGFVRAGERTRFLQGETYSEVWAYATAWLAEMGIALDQDYEIEYERGGSSYVCHEQE